MGTSGDELKKLSKEDIGNELDGVIVTAVKLIYAQSGFVIFACKGGFSCKGYYGADIIPEARYRISGVVTSYQDKPQISASVIEIVNDEETALNYVSSFLSDNIEGVGPKLASVLASEYGENVLDAILEDPNKVATKIPGLSSQNALSIAAQIESDIIFLRLILSLRLMGLSNRQAHKAFDEFGDDCKDRIKANPYILMRISGIGFETCETIAKTLHTEPLSISRFEGAVASSVSALHEENGDTYLDPLKVRNRTFSLLSKSTGGIPDDIFDGLYNDALIRAKEDRFITIFRFLDGKCRGCEASDDGARIAASEFFGTEAAIKKEIESFLNARSVKPEEKKTRELIRKMGRDRGITLDPLQEDALYLCMYSPISIITGGPGTGKTTITSILAEHFKKNKIEFEFCAPTGRAAKRLSEASGVKASTIHRLLEMSAPPEDEEGGQAFFGRNRSNPLECRVVVADEASMIDIFLFKALLDALPKGASLILVGDPEQLPPVGAGNVLEDLISCRSIPSVKLEYIFRQDDEGSIASNAVRILRGEYPVPGNDFEIISTEYDEDAIPLITDFSVKNKHGDFAILSPTRRNLLGTENLNKLLQERNNEDADEPVNIRADLVLYEGDNVMQVKNNYSIEFFDPSSNGVEHGIFNGETGRFKGYDVLTGKYDIIYDGDRKIGYDKKQMADVELAYAVTVHKAQGCEFDHVLVVLGNMNYKLSNKKLLYTAVTRGRNKVTVIDSGGRLSKMLRAEGDFRRKTSLSDFLEIVAQRHKDEPS